MTMVTETSVDLGAEDQAALMAFSRPLVLPGLLLWVTLLNDRTIDALWRGSRAHHALQIETAIAGMVCHLSGIVTAPTVLTPKTGLVQDGQIHKGVVVNAVHAAGRPVPQGAAVLGLLEFPKAPDLTRPFDVILSDGRSRFDLDQGACRRWGAVSRPEGRGF